MGLLQMSFYGAVFILVIVLVRTLAIHKLPKKVFLLLWSAALLRLLLPVSIPSAVSAYNLANQSPAVQSVLRRIPETSPGFEVLQRKETPEATALPVAESDLDSSAIMIVWLCGLVLFQAFFTVLYLRNLVEFQTSLPVSNRFTKEWLQEHPLKRKISVRQSDRIFAPLTYGLFRPVILLPKATEWGREDQLNYILLHEYTHICHCDTLLKLLLTAVCCIHWFNPFVWVMYVLFNRDMELACDECVVRQSETDARSSYALTLIWMEEKQGSYMPFVNSFSKTAIEERIRAIMKTKKVTAGILVMSVIVIAAVVLLFATSARNMVPNVVVKQAEILVENWYEKENHTAVNTYYDWRISTLEHSYSYKNYDGMALELYLLEYEFLPEPGDVNFTTGGMMMTEEGWIILDAQKRYYLVFEKTGNQFSYMDCYQSDDEAEFPGNELFETNLRYSLAGSNAFCANATAGMLRGISEDGITVDVVEYVIDENTKRKNELIQQLGLVEGNDLIDGSFLDGYFIHDPESELTTWKFDEDVVFTFIDWSSEFTGEAGPYYYTTKDRNEFARYAETYVENQSKMPFFFKMKDGKVTSVSEKFIP